jgi:tRNA pseudouridine13 synthase
MDTLPRSDPERPQAPARGASLPVAVIRRTPQDFVVEEIPLYPPSGSGEHLYVTFRKTGKTTLDAVRDLSLALGVDPRGAGYAGMKDRHAVTTQSATFPFPIARDAEQALQSISVPGIEVLDGRRHHNKLKPGHLSGNRFILTLRDVPDAEVDPLRARLEELGRRGVPNAFGPQRFGRDGDNAAHALAWLAGKVRGPRDRREQRLLFSSLQSMLFNRVLERRVADGSWCKVLPGDLAKKHDTGGMFPVPLSGPELEDARSRAETCAISATGPMFGVKMRWPEGEPLALERAVLAEVLEPEADLAAFRHLGEGTRRPLRLEITELNASRASTEQSAQGAGQAGIVVRFVLPKGGYATTVLENACELRDERGRAAPSDGPATGPLPRLDPRATETETPDEDEEP